MSLLIAIPCAIASAIAYGGSTAVEHSAAHEPDGTSGVARVLGLLRNPRWLLGLGGDTLGLIFQIIALSTGPVILVQPILILALPVSLPVAWLIGGPRPRPVDYRWCAVILVALSLFFLTIGTPGPAVAMTSAQVLAATAAVVGVGGALLIAAQLLLRARGNARAAIFGGVAGGWFGFVAVLMDAASTVWDDGGMRAMGEGRGIAPLAVLIVLGTASIALTQVAFQIGSLSASFPSNMVANPVVAVALGALLLQEDIPLSPVHIAAYLICLGVITVGTVRLAAERIERAPVAR